VRLAPTPLAALIAARGGQAISFRHEHKRTAHSAVVIHCRSRPWPVAPGWSCLERACAEGAMRTDRSDNCACSALVLPAFGPRRLAEMDRLAGREPRFCVKNSNP